MDKLHKKAAKIMIDDIKQMTNEQIGELLFYEQNIIKRNEKNKNG